MPCVRRAQVAHQAPDGSGAPVWALHLGSAGCGSGSVAAAPAAARYAPAVFDVVGVEEPVRAFSWCLYAASNTQPQSAGGRCTLRTRLARCSPLGTSTPHTQDQGSVGYFGLRSAAAGGLFLQAPGRGGGRRLLRLASRRLGVWEQWQVKQRRGAAHAHLLSGLLSYQLP